VFWGVNRLGAKDAHASFFPRLLADHETRGVVSNGKPRRMNHMNDAVIGKTMLWKIYFRYGGICIRHIHKFIIPKEQQLSVPNGVIAEKRNNIFPRRYYLETKI
jgi:hypothetical protein